MKSSKRGRWTTTSGSFVDSGRVTAAASAPVESSHFGTTALYESGGELCVQRADRTNDFCHCHVSPLVVQDKCAHSYVREYGTELCAQRADRTSDYCHCHKSLLTLQDRCAHSYVDTAVQIGGSIFVSHSTQQRLISKGEVEKSGSFTGSAAFFIHSVVKSRFAATVSYGDFHNLSCPALYA